MPDVSAANVSTGAPELFTPGYGQQEAAPGQAPYYAPGAEGAGAGYGAQGGYAAQQGAGALAGQFGQMGLGDKGAYQDLKVCRKLCPS